MLYSRSLLVIHFKYNSVTCTHYYTKELLSQELIQTKLSGFFTKILHPLKSSYEKHIIMYVVGCIYCTPICGTPPSRRNTLWWNLGLALWAETTCDNFEQKLQEPTQGSTNLFFLLPSQPVVLQLGDFSVSLVFGSEDELEQSHRQYMKDIEHERGVDLSCCNRLKFLDCLLSPIT